MTNETGHDAHPDLHLKDPLLIAAAEILSKHAFADVAVEAAAQRAGVDVAEALRRYPSTPYLARGIYGEVLDAIPGQLVELEAAGADLHDRLCALVVTEIQMLAPYKGFVGHSIRELLNPLSHQILLDLPLMQRLLAYVNDQIRGERSAGRLGAWVSPNVAAAAFGVLHAQIITYWLVVDTTHASTKTLAFLDRSIGIYVAALQSPLRFLGVSASVAVSRPVTRPAYQTRPIAGSAHEPGPVKTKKKRAS
jgi:hypothetical protein